MARPTLPRPIPPNRPSIAPTPSTVYSLHPTAEANGPGAPCSSRQRTRQPARTKLGILAILGGLLVGSTSAKAETIVEVKDVGQGQLVLVQTDDYVYLVDAGTSNHLNRIGDTSVQEEAKKSSKAKSAYDKYKAEKVNAYNKLEAELAGWFKTRTNGRNVIIIASHPDADHINLFPVLLRQLADDQVKAAYLGGDKYSAYGNGFDASGRPVLRQYLKDKRVKTYTSIKFGSLPGEFSYRVFEGSFENSPERTNQPLPQPGSSLPDVDFHVLASLDGASPNEKSLVVGFTDQSPGQPPAIYAILGDLEGETAEGAFTKRLESYVADAQVGATGKPNLAIVLGHHGTAASLTPTLETYLKSKRADVHLHFAVSAGIDNSYGHPSLTTMNKAAPLAAPATEHVWQAFRKKGAPVSSGKTNASVWITRNHGGIEFLRGPTGSFRVEKKRNVAYKLRRNGNKKIAEEMSCAFLPAGPLTVSTFVARAVAFFTVSSCPEFEEILEDPDAFLERTAEEYARESAVVRPLDALAALRRDQARLVTAIHEALGEERKFFLADDGIDYDAASHTLQLEFVDDTGEPKNVILEEFDLETHDVLTTLRDEAGAIEGAPERANRAQHALLAYGTAAGLYGSIEALERGDVADGLLGLGQTINGITEAAGINRAVYRAASRGLGRMLGTSASEALVEVRVATSAARAADATSALSRFAEDLPFAGTAFGAYNIAQDLRRGDALGYVDAGLDGIITALGLVEAAVPEAIPFLAPVMIALTIIRMGIDFMWEDISSEIARLPPGASKAAKAGAVLKGIGEGLGDIVTFGAVGETIRMKQAHAELEELRETLADASDIYSKDPCPDDIDHAEGESCSINFAGGGSSFNGGRIHFSLGECAGETCAESRLCWNDDCDESDFFPIELPPSAQTIVLGIGETHHFVTRKQEAHFLWWTVASRDVLDHLEGDESSLVGVYEGNSSDNRFIAVRDQPKGLEEYSLEQLRYELDGREGDDAFELGPQNTFVRGGSGRDLIFKRVADSVLVLDNIDGSATPATDLVVLNDVRFADLSAARAARETSRFPDAGTCFDGKLNVATCSVTLQFAKHRGRVTLRNWFLSPAQRHLQFVTADGVVFAIGAERETVKGDEVDNPPVDLDVRALDLSDVSSSESCGPRDADVCGDLRKYPTAGSIIGSNYDDDLVGNSRANYLNGGDGDDRLSGEEGPDVYELAGEGTVTIDNRSVDQATDILMLSAVESDALESRIVGDDLQILDNETLRATVEGWTRGARFRHLHVVTKSRDTFRPEPDGQLSLITISGNAALDLVAGETLETVLGSPEADSIVANGLDNVLSNGGGFDVLTGGDGHDTYVISRAGASDKHGAKINNAATDGELDVVQLDVRFDDSSAWVDGDTLHWASSDRSLAVQLEGWSSDISRQHAVFQSRDGYHAVFDEEKATLRPVALDLGRAECRTAPPPVLGCLAEYADGIAVADTCRVYELQAATLHPSVTTIQGAHGRQNAVCGNDANNGVTGGAFDDLLYGGDGDDTLKGYEGDDRLRGGAGDDILAGGAGNDHVWGDSGDDTFVAGSGKDRFIGGDGSDTLVLAALGDDARSDGYHVDLENGTAIRGDHEIDLETIENVFGSEHDDKLVGSASAPNLLDGRDGADVLVPRGEASVLAGGEGADLYDLAHLEAQPTGLLVIRNFASDREEDLLRLPAHSRSDESRVGDSRWLFIHNEAGDSLFTIVFQDWYLGDAHQHLRVEVRVDAPLPADTACVTDGTDRRCIVLTPDAEESTPLVLEEGFSADAVILPAGFRAILLCGDTVVVVTESDNLPSSCDTTRDGRVVFERAPDPDRPICLYEAENFGGFRQCVSAGQLARLSPPAESILVPHEMVTITTDEKGKRHSRTTSEASIAAAESVYAADPEARLRAAFSEPAVMIALRAREGCLGIAEAQDGWDGQLESCDDAVTQEWTIRSGDGGSGAVKLESVAVPGHCLAAGRGTGARPALEECVSATEWALEPRALGFVALAASGTTGCIGTNGLWDRDCDAAAEWLVAPKALAPTRLAAGDRHACAVTTNGVACWGWWLADGRVPDNRYPAQSISISAETTCTLGDDFGVACWENDGLERALPAQLRGRAMRQATKQDEAFTCVIEWNHEVTCYRSEVRYAQDPNSIPPRVLGSATWPVSALDLTVDNGTVCALLADSSIECFPLARIPDSDGAHVTIPTGIDWCRGNEARDIEAHAASCRFRQRADVSDVSTVYAKDLSLGRTGRDCAIELDGQGRCWPGFDIGDPSEYRSMLRLERGGDCFIDANNAVLCYSRGSFDARVGAGRVVETVHAPYADDDYGCGVDKERDLVCWGLEDTNRGHESFIEPPDWKLVPSALATFNASYSRPATQSSDASGGVAARAVDGKIDGNWSRGSVTHTSTMQSPWWQVTLDGPRTVTGVTLWNRTDCCSARLANFRVEYLAHRGDEAAPVVVAATTVSFEAGIATEIGLVAHEIDEVRVELLGNAPLSLAEVQVWTIDAIGDEADDESALATPSPTASWTFDDVRDAAGSRLGGEVHGPVSFPEHGFGRAAAFDPWSWVQVPHDPTLHSNSMTWVFRFQAGQESQTSGRQYLLGKGPDCQNGYFCALQPDGRLSCSVASDAGWCSDLATVESSGPLEPGVWHTAAWVVDSADRRANLFIEGDLVATAELGPDHQQRTNTAPVSFGRYILHPSYPYQFGGAMDDVLYFNRALDAATVRRISMGLPSRGHELRNPEHQLCLDSLGRSGPALMRVCHGHGGTQAWVLDPASGELRNPGGDLCLEGRDGADSPVMAWCHGRGEGQRWTFDRETGQVENAELGTCLDSWGRAGEARLWRCHGQGGNQRFSDHEILVFDEFRHPASAMCLDSFGTTGPVQMYPCHGLRGNQRWLWDPQSGGLYNPTSRLCIEADPDGSSATMAACDMNVSEQRWGWDADHGELRWLDGNACLDPRVGEGAVALSSCTIPSADGFIALPAGPLLDAECGGECPGDTACVEGQCVVGRRVFITSTTYDAGFGSTDAADVACQSRARDSGMGGVWTAWLSGNGENAPSRIGPSAGHSYYRLDGTRVAEKLADFTDGSLYAPINISEFGEEVRNREVWTGTSSQGNASATCDDWKNRTSSAPHATVGFSDATDSAWTSKWLQFCDRTNVALYCFER